MQTNTFLISRGFTLIEVIVVLGLVILIGNIALSISFDEYRTSSYRGDRTVLISLLQHARAQSIHAVCLEASCTQGTSHGVAIRGNTYVLFEGATYDTRVADLDGNFDANPTVARTGLTEVVFQSLSGNVTKPGDITLTAADGHSSVITVSSEAQIRWTN